MAWASYLVLILTSAPVKELPEPVKSFQLHEWGVWRLRNAKLDHLEELAREVPSFVQRAPQTATVLTPRPRLQIAKKPVIYLYSDTLLDVRVTVEMPGGQPWLYWPEAVAGVTEAPEARALSWNLKVFPLGSGSEIGQPPAPANHWWNILRAVPSSRVLPQGSAQGESFLFYDGLVPFTPRWRIREDGFAPIADLAETTSKAWVLAANRLERVDAARGKVTARTRLRNIAAVRAQLRAELIQLALSPAEADSLLGTWQGDLFEGNKRHAIWILPRAAYDQMLPLRVDPLPEKIVRVGVVIEELPSEQ